MENPTITHAQALKLDAKWKKFLEGLDTERAAWLISHHQVVEDFVLRRPEGGILTRRFVGTFDVQDFKPRRKTLGDAGLLKYDVSAYSGGDDQNDLFPGTYHGPAKVHFEMHAHVGGGPPYRESSMHDTPTGLSRVAIDLKERGFQLANFHQAASLAARLAATMTAEDWIRHYGACRIYALDTQLRGAHSRAGTVPVFLSPGVEDDTAFHEKRSQRWRLEREHLDRADYDGNDAWFLTVTPAR